MGCLFTVATLKIMKITTLKRTIAWGFISSLVLLAPLDSQAVTVEEVTNPRQDNGGWVTDMADILSDDTEARINNLITELEQSNGAEIAVVTVPDTAPATPKAFATELFNYWGIGKADTNNGVLYLISVSDRRVEIETGTGLQTILSDAKVQNIIDTRITPQYKQDNYDRGTLDGTEALVAALDSTPASNKNWLLFPLVGGIGIVFARGFIEWRKRRNSVYLNPQQATKTLPRSDERDIYCAKCKQPMTKVENIQLTKAQKVASKLGGVSYRGYKCSSCSDTKNPYVILSYVSDSSRYQPCPHCQELTVIRSEEALEEATQNSEGKRLITRKCHCCDYQTEKIVTIPRLYSHSRDRNNLNNRDRSNNYHHTYFDSSYSGSSYSGSSGSDFGGGSSDGGGAGGDW